MPGSLLIHNARLILPDDRAIDGWLHAVDSRIARIGTDDPPPPAEFVIDAHGAALLPGFIDVHVHGGAGVEAMDATPDALIGMARFAAAHGVTSFLPTTWTDTGARILAALQAIAAMVERETGGARILGAHVEGPYLNPTRVGAQNPEFIRRAEPDEARGLLDTGAIRLFALAPEFPENQALIRDCVARGITVSAAHTAASYDQMQEAIALGLRHVTHTFNAMGTLHHREPGVVGAALSSPELVCELIADNLHVHPAAMRVLWLAKGRDGVILITDAIRGAGMPDGDYPIDDRVITIRNGEVRLPDGTLAGSTLTMERALYNFMQATGAPLEAGWRATSLNAARAIGIAGDVGSLEVGKRADLVLIDPITCAVHTTIVNGTTVYQT